MATGLTGDFQKLSRIVKRMARAATGEARLAVAESIAEEARVQYRRGFAESRDPYGKAWAAPVLRQGRPLLDTGRLANSFVAQVSASRIYFTIPIFYAVVHNEGRTIYPKNGPHLAVPVPGGLRLVKSVTIPQRRMVPAGGDLGRWGPPLIAAGEDAMMAFFVDAAE